MLRGGRGGISGTGTVGKRDASGQGHLEQGGACIGPGNFSLLVHNCGYERWHACKGPTHKVHAYEVHDHEMHAHEVHAHKVHAHEIHANKVVHAHQIYA